MADSDPIQLTERDAKVLRRLQRKVDGLSGDGVTNTPDMIRIKRTDRKQTATPPAEPGSPVVLLKITGNATGGGRYTARVWELPTGTITTPTGNLAVADLGTDPGADDAVAWSLPEITRSTHDLTNAANTAQKYFLGLKIGTQSDGKDVYLIGGFWWEDCS
jgi:hypothetical protein